MKGTNPMPNVVTATRTRCNKIQLEMPAETARLLFVLIGNLNIDHLKGAQPIVAWSIKSEAQAVRSMCSDLYDPLVKIDFGT